MGMSAPLGTTIMKGIFSICRHESDRNQDTLRWCFARSGQPRPKSFNVEKGSGLTCVELKRFVLDEDETIATLEAVGATVYKEMFEEWVAEVVLPDSFDPLIARRTIPKLRKLSSIVSHVADQELVKTLANHESLRSVRFRCPVAPESLELLVSRLKNLRTLGFRCKELTAEHCSAIQNSESQFIGRLRIEGNEDDLSGLETLSGLRAGTLVLVDCKLTKTGFDRVARHLPTIQALEVFDSQLTADALAPISRMKDLYTMRLEGDSVTDEHLLAIESQNHLRILGLSNTSITNVALAHVLENFPKVFSVRAEKVSFDKGIFKIVSMADPERQFDVTVSKGPISREDVESADKEIRRRIQVIGW